MTHPERLARLPRLCPGGWGTEPHPDTRESECPGCGLMFATLANAPHFDAHLVYPDGTVVFDPRLYRGR